MITSLSNPLIKQARALRQRKTRDETGLFLVEGLHPIGQALDAGWLAVHILFAPELLTSEYGLDLVKRVTQPEATIQGGGQQIAQPVSTRVMESVTEKENPQGILAILHKKQWKIAELVPVRSGLALISPQDPGNLGTILRTMDAVVADALLLIGGGVDPYHPTAVRASMGALFWKPVLQMSFDELLSQAHKLGWQLIGTSAHAETGYQDFSPKPPWILVMGNEQKGLSERERAACEVVVSLPTRGKVSSLNLGVAAGILMYQYIPPK